MTIKDPNAAAEPEIPILATPSPAPAVSAPAPAPPVVQASVVPPQPVKMEADARPNYTSTSAPPVSSASTGTGVAVRPRLGREPCRIAGQCRHCGKEGQVTRISKQPSFMTYCCCVTLFLVFWPLCWVPFVIPGVS